MNEKKRVDGYLSVFTEPPYHYRFYSGMGYRHYPYTHVQRLYGSDNHHRLHSRFVISFGLGNMPDAERIHQGINRKKPVTNYQKVE
jgi:hypothetical protein